MPSNFPQNLKLFLLNLFLKLRFTYGRFLAYVSMIPAFALFIAFAFIPMVYSFIGSFQAPQGALYWYGYVFSNPRLIRDLLFTIAVGFAAATISFFISIPAALILRKNFRGKTLVHAILMFPLVVPELIAGYSIWLTLMPRGLLYSLANYILPWITLPELSDEIKLIIACTWKYFPIMTLLTAAGWEGIDPDLEAAARTLGASPITTFFKVTLPLLIPSLISGYVLVVLRAAGQFSITLVIGGARLTTIPIDVWYQYNLMNLNLAYTLAVILTSVMVTLVIIFTKVLRRLYHAP